MFIENPNSTVITISEGACEHLNSLLTEQRQTKDPACYKHFAPMGRNMFSENELQLHKQRVEWLTRVNHIWLAEVSHARRTVAGAVRENVPKAGAGLQGRSPECDLHVIDKERTVSYSDAVIDSYVVPDTILKKKVLQRFGSMKTKIVGIEYGFDSLS